MVITTPRLFVRYLEESDYDWFSTLESDGAVKQFTGLAATIPRDRYTRFISVPSTASMAVCRKDTNHFVGRCGFRTIDDRVELEIFCFQKPSSSDSARSFSTRWSNIAPALFAS